MVGESIPHIRFFARIDEGRMGAVYRANDSRLYRQLALHVLSPDFVAHDKQRLCFLKEALSETDEHAERNRPETTS